ncbi:MAG: hypothetical protein DIU75_001260 [Mycolicibacterium hassiacum]|nr:hypothetical protein [Mycolicibacterium hassiacum]
MQAGRLLEPDDHITIRLPPLLMDVSLQVLGEGRRGEVRVGTHLLVVGNTEGNDVVIRRQNLPAPQAAGPGVGFPAQNGLDLLRHDRAAEDPGEGVPDGRFELALDTVGKTHVTASLARC